MFLLDTNVLSELRKAGDGKADANVIAWVDSVDAATLFLSAITLLDRAWHPPNRASRCRSRRSAPYLDDPSRVARVSRSNPTVDAAVALRCASLHVPDPRAERDALIAATALVHGMTVVTRNVASFEAAGVPILNPWDAGRSLPHAGLRQPASLTAMFAILSGSW